MVPSKHCVLVDLSYATLGYCGIAQESRLLLKALYRTQGIEATGLLFSRNDASIWHRFDSEHGQARCSENQALFMQTLVDGPPRPANWLQRVLRSVRLRWRSYVARGVTTGRLDNDWFWDVVWRNLLAPSLADHDIELAQRCPMLLANLGLRMLLVTSRWHLPRVRLDTTGQDFALFQNAVPIRVSPGTRKLIRYYDLIPGVRPDLVGGANDIEAHFRDIRRCLKDSIFVCISEPVRTDLLRAFPELEGSCACIPVVLADGYYPEHQPRRLPQILVSRQCSVAATHPPAGIQKLLEASEFPPYILMAATLDPRKNHVAVVRAFEQLIARHQTDLRLVIVGNAGWKSTEAIRAMAPLIAQERLFHLQNVTQAEMRLLYSHARALVFPSLYEGFGYPPLEAMSCGTPAVISDIAAHRWACGDAALYCDPYRVQSLVEALERLLFSGDESLRHTLVERGFACVRQYSASAIGPKWLQLFDDLRGRGLSMTCANQPAAAA
jgi:glycosyltransferase involved in cell wall biosynthesis